MGTMESDVRPCHPPTSGERQMKKLIAAIIAGSFMLTACNTMEGFGRDVEKTGDKIENSAAKRK